MRRAAARSQCANNLKEIALGLHQYAETGSPASTAEYDHRFPAGTISNPALPPERRLSWFVEVLPFLERTNVYTLIDRKAAWDSTTHTAAVQNMVRTFHCPDWGRQAEPDPPYLTAYLGVSGVGPAAATLAPGDPHAGMFGYDRRTAVADVTDGTSRTLLILESARDNGPWARGGPATVRGLDPVEAPYLGSGRPFSGTHFADNSWFSRGGSVGCNAAFVDGSVRFLKDDVTPHVLEALATVAGGEVIDGGW